MTFVALIRATPHPESTRSPQEQAVDLVEQIVRLVNHENERVRPNDSMILTDVQVMPASERST